MNMMMHELKYKCEVRKENATLPPERCRPGQVNQVFMNLVVNAAHAIEKNGVITLHSSEAGIQKIQGTGHRLPPISANLIL